MGTLRWKSQLNALRAFEAVARLGSMTRAASELCVTLGAVSQQVKRLEATLGVQLLSRHHRSLELTDCGTRLSASLTAGFDEIETTINSIATPPPANRLRLKVTPSFAIRWLMPNLPSFYNSHPEFDIEVGTFQKQIDVKLEDADFIVRHGDGSWKDGVCYLIFRDELTPACSPSVALTLNEPSDLAHHTLLHSIRREDGWSGWLAENDLANLQPRYTVNVANEAIGYQSAVDGLGVALVQKRYVQDDIASGKLVFPFLHTQLPQSGYYLVCSRQLMDQPHIRAFRHWIAGLAG